MVALRLLLPLQQQVQTKRDGRREKCHPLPQPLQHQEPPCQTALAAKQAPRQAQQFSTPLARPRAPAGAQRKQRVSRPRVHFMKATL